MKAVDQFVIRVFLFLINGFCHIQHLRTLDIRNADFTDANLSKLTFFNVVSLTNVKSTDNILSDTVD